MWRRICAVAAALAVTVLAAGCHTIADTGDCPGKGCSVELNDLSRLVRQVPGVTRVSAIQYNPGVDGAAWGSIHVLAAPGDGDLDAQALTHRLAELYPKGALKVVHQVDVILVWDPTENVTVYDDLHSASPGSAHLANPCAVRCARLLPAFSRSLRGGLADLSLARLTLEHRASNDTEVDVVVRSSVANPTQPQLAGWYAEVRALVSQVDATAGQHLHVVLAHPGIRTYTTTYTPHPLGPERRFVDHASDEPPAA